jgi:RNA-binding protein PNO1
MSAAAPAAAAPGARRPRAASAGDDAMGGGGGGGGAARRPRAASAGGAAEAAADGAAAKPSFPALGGGGGGGAPDESRSVRVPTHRYTPLKEAWESIVAPIVEHMKLMIRMNARARAVEIKTSAFTTDAGALQRAEDFVRAFLLGFEVRDALALLRMEDLFVESFEVTDVKPLKGDHLSRAIGRIAGQSGKTKHAIENATRVRIVIADSKVHILGAFANIQVARDAVCSLILGSPPGKVYNAMCARGPRGRVRHARARNNRLFPPRPPPLQEKCRRPHEPALLGV